MATIPQQSLADLPDEILLRILSFIHIQDLLQLSRTCHNLRTLACDPVLHLQRLHDALSTVSYALTHRPTRASLSPPNAWICLSRTNVLSRQISRSLTKIRLAHNLERRPSTHDLVLRAILPASCTTYSSMVSPALIQSHRAIQKQRLKDKLGRKLERRPSVQSLVSQNIMPEECARKVISPVIFAKRRQVIRESLKDGLRAWVEGRGLQAQRRKADELEFAERKTVKNLAKRFTAFRMAAEDEQATSHKNIEKGSGHALRRFGREVEIARRRDERRDHAGCSQPTRAHVLGLRRYWEGLIRAAS